jgi:hypothetical protein
MNPQTDPLAGLRDIHLPDAVSLWPLAPGWWLIAAAIAVAVGLAIWSRRRHLASVRRAAMRELDDLCHQFDADGDSVSLAEHLSALLRRVALVRFGQTHVAPLHGPRWVEFLTDATRSGAFPSDVATQIEHTMYAGPKATPDPEQVKAWLTAGRRWIRSVS